MTASVIHHSVISSRLTAVPSLSPDIMTDSAFNYIVCTNIKLYLKLYWLDKNRCQQVYYIWAEKEKSWQQYI